MEIKLANHHKHTFDEVISAKNNGGCFITYQWILPRPLVHPVRRLSKVYFIPSGTDKAKYARKYNIISLLIGWWGLPGGPIAVHKSILLNNSGGVDVTDDVYLNLTKNGYLNGRFQLKQSFTKFTHPPKSELKEHLKIFKALKESNEIKNLPIIGIYIDGEEGIEPPTIIGFTENIGMKRSLITKAIYKRFSKHFEFELVQLHNGYSLSKELSTQGITLE